jgi:hypothetical protein
MTPEPATPVIVINGQEYPGLTRDDLTLGELEIVERCGAPLPNEDGEIDQTLDPTGRRWLTALVTITLTRAAEDTEGIDTIKVSQIELKGYPEANGGPPPNRAARRSRAANGATAKPGNAKNAAGGQAAQHASSGNQPTATTST